MFLNKPNLNPNCKLNFLSILVIFVYFVCSSFNLFPPQVLYEHCDRLRPSLFRLASETTDDDTALAQILAANDELTQAVATYKGRAANSEGDQAGRGQSSEEGKAVDGKL